MLPAQQTANTYHADRDEIDVRPGSWWRLVSTDHELASREAPEHGLILMVAEARHVDGELHTVLLYPHPLWGGRQSNRSVKMLIEDFLLTFTPEPDGEALREIEINALMGRVAEITAEIANPPPDQLLLERQTESKKTEEAEESAGAAELDLPPQDTSVPAILLPSEDIVAAQQMIENRIAVFEAKRNWITDRTKDLTATMGLVATYQGEKVDGALASISQETNKATELLKSVQTMRLFLGEDMCVTTLLEGESADPSEPLTFLQRMLYLDEEVYIHDLLDGFDGECMGDLPAMMAADFSLVERMLPYKRSVAIARVRRKARELDMDAKMSIAALFEAIAIAQADMRIHILVRDGTRVHMITADEVTSNAERLFPSKVEIDALFKKGFAGEKQVITPDDIDYTDARARHDSRALFYKRFLLILWGVHERSDVFGPFAPKGINWLDGTVHSERFRFIHDEEDVLTDGRPSIDGYISAHNARIKAGSRVMVNVRQAATIDTAPQCFERSKDYSYIKGNFEHDFEVADVFEDKGQLKVKLTYHRPRNWRKDTASAPIKANVAISSPRHWNDPKAYSLFDRSICPGVICVDDLSLAEMDYYIASREARTSYARWLHLFNRTRTLVRSEEDRNAELIAELVPNAGTAEAQLFRQALKLWRSGNKWGWPETAAAKQLVLKLMERTTAAASIQDLAARHTRVMQVEMKPNGDIAIIHDETPRSMADGTPLPWFTEVLYASPASRKAKAERLISWFDLERNGQTIFQQDNSLQADIHERLAPAKELKDHFGKSRGILPHWRIPSAYADTSMAEILDKIASNHETVAELTSVINGTGNTWLRSYLDDSFANYESSRDYGVQLPVAHAHIGLIHGGQEDGVKSAWLVGVSILAREFAWANGLKDEVTRHCHRLYASPSRVIAKLDKMVHPGVMITYDRISTETSGRSIYTPVVCLSSMSEKTVLAAPPLTEPTVTGWREALATKITSPATRGWDLKYDPEALKASGSKLHLHAAPGVEELLTKVYAIHHKLA